MTSCTRDHVVNQVVTAQDPMVIFDEWHATAKQDPSIVEPNAVTVATSDAQGIPDARNVLLKEHTDDKFIFYTNYNSKKGTDLQKNPNVALVFLWNSQNILRQVRVRGTVRKCSSQKSDEYFAARARESQLGAWTSSQSQKLRGGRDELEQKYREVEEQFAGKDVPRPSHWGGFEVTTHAIEFWIGGVSGRMNDRFLFEKQADTREWTMTPLWP